MTRCRYGQRAAPLHNLLAEQPVLENTPRDPYRFSFVTFRQLTRKLDDQSGDAPVERSSDITGRYAGLEFLDDPYDDRRRIDDDQSFMFCIK